MARTCAACGESEPPCDRAVYLAHGNGGAHGTAPAHRACVEAAGEAVQGWNEDPGWYVRGEEPRLDRLEPEAGETGND